MKTQNTTKTLIALIALTALTVSANAAWLVCADTTGKDSYNTAEYYGVEYVSGIGGDFIKSISYDLAGTAGAFFDFDGDASYLNGTEPVLGTLNGLVPGDISWQLLNPVGGDPSHVSKLQLDFVPGAFGVGDSIRFAADTDYLVNDPTPGSFFGQASVPFTVMMYSGQMAYRHFFDC